MSTNEPRKNHVNADEERPMFLSFVLKISYLILSKALLMSMYTTAVALVWSIARKIASVEDINEVSVECHFLFSFLKYR